METNTCARLFGIGDLRIETSPIPEPGEGQVQVKPAYVGICGTDVHFLDKFGVEGYPLESPLVLGHETSAVVSRLGPGVTEFKVGDRVSVDSNWLCLKCGYCREGRKDLCAEMNISGIRNKDGGFANYMLTMAACCHKLPDHVTLEEAACTEPLAIGVWALHRGRLARGDTVVVLGMGPIGLMAFQAARAMGAAKTLVVDVNSSRLELAKSLGADLVHQVTKKDMENSAQLAETLRTLIGCEPDLCVECSGAPGTVDTALLLVRRAGRVVMVGFGDRKLDIHLGVAAARGVDVLGSINSNCNFPECVDLLSSGKVKAAPIITDKVPLTRILDAFELVRKDQSVKVIVDCQQ